MKVNEQDVPSIISFLYSICSPLLCYQRCVVLVAKCRAPVISCPGRLPVLPSQIGACVVDYS